MPPDGSSPNGSGPVSEPVSSLDESKSTTTLKNKEDALVKGIKGVIDESKLDPRLLDVNSDYFPPLEIVWKNVWLFVYLHGAALIGLYLFLTGQVHWKTVVWAGLVHVCGALGITAGAHRLWSHKSYKAKLPLRIILTFMQTVSFQNSIHEWSRDHRVHHKYSETHADPHNAKRGFFFAHMGWLICRKHPLVKIKGAQIDMSDLESDPVIMFQKKWYVPLVLFTSFIMPSFVPWFFWGESLIASWCFAAQLRYCFNLHCTWLVNSAAHMYGNKPYDKNINPSENKSVAIFAFGEGWHNYHHTFPWDYKTAEVGLYRYNFTAAFVDFFAWIGWAYDLKTVSHKMIADRITRTGDGSHESLRKVEETNLTAPQASQPQQSTTVGHHHSHGHLGPWGWGDSDISKEDAEVTETLYPYLVDTSKED